MGGGVGSLLAPTSPGSDRLLSRCNVAGSGRAVRSSAADGMGGGVGSLLAPTSPDPGRLLSRCDVVGSGRALRSSAGSRVVAWRTSDRLCTHDAGAAELTGMRGCGDLRVAVVG